MKRMLTVLGILSGLFYLAAVVTGDLLRDDYNALANSISELTLTGADYKEWMDLLFTLYNLSLLGFGLGLARSGPIELSWTRLGGWVLTATAFFGLLMYFFPQDPRHTEATLAGTVHLILAGILSPLTILAVLFLGLGVRRPRAMRFYSYGSCLFILLTGGYTALHIDSPYMGLYERFTILGFILWLIVYSGSRLGQLRS
ncbi:DUF998 domain-containing protein [Gorillibacterium sp. sgz5001074]|uniref:DUF998 domain-containing protein n=1 Tax=Gorillibacterium sp. sgz5001074 TaxID=3446695 RepID=UPI003F67E239